MNYEPFQNLPMVLETPIHNEAKVENTQIWADEIKLLEGLIGRDPEDAEFLAEAEELQSKGASERAKINGQVDKKAEKDAAAAAKKGSKGKGKKKAKVEDSDPECSCAE